MNILFSDFETRCGINLKKSGMYPYIAHKTFQPLGMSHAMNDAEPEMWWWHENKMPPLYIYEHIKSGGEVWAFNAPFEYNVFLWLSQNTPYWPRPRIEQFQCIMVMALELGFPGSLENVAPALGLDIRKDNEGRLAMLRLCQPRPDGTFIEYEQEPLTYATVGRYCIQDLLVERAACRRLVQISQKEKKYWLMDQYMNQRGIGCDLPAVAEAITICDRETARLDAEMEKVTGLAVPSTRAHTRLAEFLNLKSVAKGELIEYLALPSAGEGELNRKERFADSVDDRPLDTCAEAVMRRLEDEIEKNGAKKRAAQIRLEAARSSVAKLKTMLATVSSADSRIRGMFQFYGSHTGRWAGRGVQPQNFPRGTLKLKAAQQNFILHNLDLIESVGHPCLSIISDCLRGFLVAAPGYEFHAVDFSSIEARLLAWQAGDQDYLSVFRGHGKIYEYEAATILSLLRRKTIKMEDITSEERQRYGKVPVLSLGYQGGKHAFQRMGKAYGVKVSVQEAEIIVKAWREAHPAPVKFWADCEAAALEAVSSPGKKVDVRGVIFGMARIGEGGDALFIKLPSGRLMSYPYPRVEMIRTPWGTRKDAVTTMVLDSTIHRWIREPKYGGLWCENIIQGEGTDYLREGLLRVDDAGIPVVGCFHDEGLTETPIGEVPWQVVADLMAQIPEWAPDLPMGVTGWTGPRYRKD